MATQAPILFGTSSDSAHCSSRADGRYAHSISLYTGGRLRTTAPQLRYCAIRLCHSWTSKGQFTNLDVTLIRLHVLDYAGDIARRHLKNSVSDRGIISSWSPGQVNLGRHGPGAKP